MSIKHLGLSLWNSTASKSNASKQQPKRLSQSEATPVGFGLPSPEDPDPFGVRALELAGLEIKEAGSSSKPSVDAFDYRPSPTSPVFRLSTQSLDLAVNSDLGYSSRRTSKRISKRSLFSLRHDHSASEPRHSISARNSISDSRNSISEGRASTLPSPRAPTISPRGSIATSITSPRGSIVTSAIPSPSVATFAIEGGIVSSPVAENNPSRPISLKSAHIQLPETIPETISEAREETVEEIDDAEEEDESEDEMDDFDDEEGDIIIEEVSTSAVPVVPTVLAAPIAVKAKVVTLKRRGPPALPLKSPMRPRFFDAPARESSTQDSDGFSSTYSLSPDKGSFDKSESSNPWSEQTSLQDNESIHHKDLAHDASTPADHEDLGKSAVISEEKLEDVQETTPIAISAQSNALIQSEDSNTDLMEEHIEKVMPTKEIEKTEEVTPVTVSKLDNEILPSSEHISSNTTTAEENSKTEEVTQAITSKSDNDIHFTSEHKSSISGSTLASITEQPTMIKSNSEQSLANLIKQGLQSALVDEEDYTSSSLNHYYDAEEVTSEYEDDGPVSPPSPTGREYSTPGAFMPEPIH